MELKIIARSKEGIRRCGVFHPGDQAVVHPAGTFTQEQLEVLRKDKDLIVGDGVDNLADNVVPIAQHLAVVEECAASKVELGELRKSNHDAQQSLDAERIAHGTTKSMLSSTQSQLSTATQQLDAERVAHQATREQLSNAKAAADSKKK